jgi:hypothetical protein
LYLLTIMKTSSSSLRKVHAFSKMSKKSSLRKYAIFNSTFSEPWRYICYSLSIIALLWYSLANIL